MIKYKLECESCKNKFDSWFSTSKEFDKLKKLNFLNCSLCNSKKVKKSIMSPKILNNNYIKKNNGDEKRLRIFKNKMREYQRFIKNNFDYVGENFSYEARSIHYNSKNKNSKGIYGRATNDEIKSLNEEGIETQNIPWLEEKEN
tara:strand:+ start:1955 stop:2386 length:432 start_codon:yes stop_codon:yes gene_type:complete